MLFIRSLFLAWILCLTVFFPSPAEASDANLVTVYPSQVSSSVPISPQSFHVTYHFSAASPLSQSYTVFVHFVNSAGSVVFGADHVPPTPTNRWKGTETYSETVTAPASTPAGTYTLQIGLYSPNTGARVPLLTSSSVVNLGGDAYETASLNIAGVSKTSAVLVYPLASGEPISPTFKVWVNGMNSPVYLADVQAQKGYINPASPEAGKASITSFDIANSATIQVTLPNGVISVKVLPTSAGIHPSWNGKQISFPVFKAAQLTLEVNGDALNSLHLFVNPMDTNIPSPTATNVVYYPAGTNTISPLTAGAAKNLIYLGPGVHHINSINITAGETVYLAPGAIVYGVPGSPIKPIITLTGTKYGPTANQPVTLRGRGIIDGSLYPKISMGNTVFATGNNTVVKDVTLRNSDGNWTYAISWATEATASNVKILSALINADGIDIDSSSNVTVTDSFVRAYDDLIVLKTQNTIGLTDTNITVSGCVLWNQVAHALSIGAEIKQNISNVQFLNSDIIHDRGGVFLLGVLNTDNGTVQNVVFNQIRIEEVQGLMDLLVVDDIYTVTAPKQGHIYNVYFQNITSPVPERTGEAESAILTGYNSTYAISGVHFDYDKVGGNPFAWSMIDQNSYAGSIVITN